MAACMEEFVDFLAFIQVRKNEIMHRLWVRSIILIPGKFVCKLIFLASCVCECDDFGIFRRATYDSRSLFFRADRSQRFFPTLCWRTFFCLFLCRTLLWIVRLCNLLDPSCTCACAKPTSLVWVRSFHASVAADLTFVHCYLSSTWSRIHR